MSVSIASFNTVPKLQPDRHCQMFRIISPLLYSDCMFHSIEIRRHMDSVDDVTHHLIRARHGRTIGSQVVNWVHPSRHRITLLTLSGDIPAGARANALIQFPFLQPDVYLTELNDGVVTRHYLPVLFSALKSASSRGQSSFH